MRRKGIYEILHPETKAGISQTAGMNRVVGNNVAENFSATSKSFVEVFEQVKAQLPHTRGVKRGTHFYPLRGKMFCGCCRHTMKRTSSKTHFFYCGYASVDNSAPYHGLRISEIELESMLYTVLFKQAQVILNVDDLSSAGKLGMQLAKQTESGNQVEALLEKKRALYERFVLNEITVDVYKVEKAMLNKELDHLKQIHAIIAAQTQRMQTDEEMKSARTNLAHEIVRSNGLTAGLVDTLIVRVYFYPENQVEITWKINDFYREESK